MTLHRVLALTGCFSLLLLTTACPEPEENTETNNSTNSGFQNQPPTADPGANFDAVVGQRVEVSAANSSDPEGDFITVLWTLDAPDGSSSELEDDTAFRAAFTPDIVGLYKLTLVVNDGVSDSEPVPVYIRVTDGAGGNNSMGNNTTTNSAPTADAGEDKTWFLDQEIMLDGSGSNDPDGDALAYEWSILQSPPNSSVTISDETAQSPLLLADLPGLYEVQLIVKDEALESEPDTVLFNVRSTTPVNSPPVVVFNPPSTGVTGEELTFDASGSSDPDGDPISFAWTLLSAPQSSTAMISGPTAAMANFTPDVEGTYQFELVVTDSEGEGANPVTFDVVVTSVPNALPVAVISAPTFAYPDQIISLDGTQSFDDDGQSLSYQWRLLGKPAGSLVLLEQATSAIATLTPDQDGDYEVELVVNDGVSNSAPVTLSITVGQRPDTCLIISEYLEGDGNNKAIELYNCDDEPLDLAGKYVCLIRNGTTDCASEFELGGSLAQGEVVGVCNTQFQMSLVDAGDCDFTSSVMSFNGDDRIVVFEDINLDGQFDANDIVLDAFGEILFTPSGRIWEDTTYRRCDLTPYDGYSNFILGDLYDEYFNNDFSDFGLPPQPGVTCGAPPMNRAPVANAGSDRNVTTGQVVMLNGSGSSDPDNDVITFSWSLVLAPMNSMAMLDDAMLETPSFTPDVEGDYVFELVVNDTMLDSTVSTVTITALPPVMPGVGCLMISEYIEGSSSNKAVELYNCGSDPVGLDDIKLCLISNNNTSCSTVESFTGQLLAGEVFGVCNSSLDTSLVDAGDCAMFSSVTNFNGNDRLLLFRDLDLSGGFDPTQDEVLDAFGEYANPVSTLWADVTYTRCNVMSSYNGVGAFDVLTYYTASTVDDFSHFGVAPDPNGVCQ